MLSPYRPCAGRLGLKGDKGAFLVEQSACLGGRTHPRPHDKSWSERGGLATCITKIVINLNRLVGPAGGERGIRTLVRVSPKHAFQACAFNHSATSPSPTRGGPGRRKARNIRIEATATSSREKCGVAAYGVALVQVAAMPFFPKATALPTVERSFVNDRPLRRLARNLNGYCGIGGARLVRATGVEA